MQIVLPWEDSIVKCLKPFWPIYSKLYKHFKPIVTGKCTNIEEKQVCPVEIVSRAL